MKFLTQEDFALYLTASAERRATPRKDPLAEIDPEARSAVARRYDLSLRSIARSLLTTAKENFRAGRDPWATVRVAYRPAHPENQNELFAYYAEGRGYHTVLTHLRHTLVNSFVHPSEFVRVDLRPCLERNPFTHTVEFVGVEFEIELRYVKDTSDTRDPLA